MARPTLGKREDARGKVSLMSCDISSLVIDTLCRQAVGENAAFACFYFDFAAQEEQLFSYNSTRLVNAKTF